MRRADVWGDKRKSEVQRESKAWKRGNSKKKKCFGNKQAMEASIEKENLIRSMKFSPDLETKYLGDFEWKQFQWKGGDRTWVAVLWKVNGTSRRERV